MKVMVVLGHPDEASFNHAIAMTAVEALEANGHEVIFHDLYAEHFDPVLTLEEMTSDEIPDAAVRAQCKELAAAEGLVIVHPNWWCQPPALVKGWIDRVFRHDVAYTMKEENGQEVLVGLLKLRSALVLNTCMTTADQDRDLYGDPLDHLWKTAVLGFCQVKDVRRHNFRMVQMISQDERKTMLEAVTAAVKGLYPAPVA